MSESDRHSETMGSTPDRDSDNMSDGTESPSSDTMSDGRMPADSDLMSNEDDEGRARD